MVTTARRLVMCLAVPSKVIELKKNLVASVELDGLVKDVSIELVPEVVVGDYVIVHVGFALSIIDEEEAKKNLQIYEIYK